MRWSRWQTNSNKGIDSASDKGRTILQKFYAGSKCSSSLSSYFVEQIVERIAQLKHTRVAIFRLSFQAPCYYQLKLVRISHLWAHALESQGRLRNVLHHDLFGGVTNEGHVTRYQLE